jgi:hypothetical protein
VLEGKALKDYVSPAEAFYQDPSGFDQVLAMFTRNAMRWNTIEVTCTEVRGELNAASTETNT